MQALSDLWPLLAYMVLVVALVGALLALSYVAGPRTRDRDTGDVYESGVLPIGPAHVRFHARFYLIALFFLIFDLESVFIYAWAISLREVGWTGYTEMAVFIFVLVAALAYLWKMGALDWAPDSAEIARRREERTRRDASRSSIPQPKTAARKERDRALVTEQIR